ASSALAEVTKNQTYIDSSLSSRNFYLYHLRNQKGVMLDGINADHCSPSDQAFPANPGIMMEGLAVLGSVSNPEDTDAIFSDLVEIVNKTVSNNEWYNINGILAADDLSREFAELVGQYVIRGLVAFYNRNTTQSSLRTYIKEYVAVQYNAVMSNARGQGENSNTYGAPWTGAQQPLNFSLPYQTNALSILVPAITIGNDTSDTPRETGRPQPTTPEAKTRLNVGVIVGGVAAGLAVMAFLTILALWLIRRRRRSRQISNANPTRSDNLAQSQIEPFRNPALEKSGHRGEKRLSAAPRDLEQAEDMSSTDLDYTDTDISSSQGSFRLDGELSTADLVMLLNHRLRGQGRDWREDEQPPDYVSEGSSPTRNLHRSVEK
ncbi:hypothetical protein V5O48_010229, partial [Marasmius crinis-equi]